MFLTIVKREGTFDTQQAAPSVFTLAGFAVILEVFSVCGADCEQLAKTNVHKTPADITFLNIIINNVNVKVTEKC